MQTCMPVDCSENRSMCPQPISYSCKKSQNQLTQVGKSERRGGQGKMNEKREKKKEKKMQWNKTFTGLKRGQVFVFSSSHTIHSHTPSHLPLPNQITTTSKLWHNYLMIYGPRVFPCTRVIFFKSLHVLNCGDCCLCNVHNYIYICHTHIHTPFTSSHQRSIETQHKVSQPLCSGAYIASYFQMGEGSGGTFIWTLHQTAAQGTRKLAAF